MNPELDRKLRYLRLSGMATALPARNQEAIHHHLAYPEFLELLVEDELATRRDRLFARRLKQAGIAEVKSLESYDWSFNPQVPRGLILDLATARFVREHGGVLLLGPPGTGKSHIATALTVSAIQAGHTALYRSAFDLAQDMAEAEATGTRKELIDNLCKVDLLVLEDLGMKRQDYPPEKTPYTLRSPNYMRQMAELGEDVGVFGDRLLGGPLPWSKLRQAQKVVRLGEKYTPSRLNAACRRALEVDLIDVRRLERILSEALENEATSVTTMATATPPGRFARPGNVFAVNAKEGEPL